MDTQNHKPISLTFFGGSRHGHTFSVDRHFGRVCFIKHDGPIDAFSDHRGDSLETYHVWDFGNGVGIAVVEPYDPVAGEALCRMLTAYHFGAKTVDKPAVNATLTPP